VNLERVPLLLLKGTAGCGKTTIGIYRAIRLAEQDRRVLVVTFNRTLASATKTLVEELIGPLPVNLTVSTAHSIMSSLLGARFNIPRGQQTGLPRQFLREALAEVRARETSQVLKRDESFFQDEIQWVLKGLDLSSVEAYKVVKRYGRKTALGPIQREAVWKVYELYRKRMEAANIHEWADAALLTLHLARLGPLARVFDDIIIDESQDFKPVELRAIQALAAPQSTIMVLGDAAQTLYSRGFSWVQAGISARGRTSILRVNYRNTSQIAEAASQLIANNTLMRSSNEYVDPLWTRRDGYLPGLLVSEQSHTQVDLVCTHILKLIGEQYRPSDIAVLCLENRVCERCKAILVGKGLRAALHSDADFDILEEQIKIMTIHSAKGLEFPVVFLVGLNEGEFPRQTRGDVQDEEEARLEIERARMLCYVGMTRAADRLFLVTVRGQESRFIREIYDKIERRLE
ncbi:MAG: 3'-5' exonuclease, partial [Ktedonobacteraceae bacterium]